ncbi:MAG: UvrD-helicase domain-containing protein [Pirellulaceae bacterium]|nr:UvrD-helicase domain-containing protein [Pirellulaceae bacterium]
MTTQTMQHELIRASAGTGKTFELTNRYLQLLHLGATPEELLATTFTRKAAGEIFERVLLRLAEAATTQSGLQELQRAFADESLSQADCQAMLSQTTRNIHRLRVGTLDSFFAQLASSFALELGLPPGWRIVEEHVGAALRRQAIDAVLDNEDKKELLTLVHALTQGETTRSLDLEVRDKINSFYPVYLESNLAAWQRIPRPAPLKNAALEKAFEQLHALALPNHATWEKTHAKQVAAAAEADWPAFIQGGIASRVAQGQEKYATKPIESQVIAAYQPFIEHAKAVHLNQLANQTEATYQLLDRFHVQYQRLKSQARALRFEDVTFLLSEAFQKIAPDQAAFRLDSHLRHLLLDEFQDTSLAQWRVIGPFARRITAAKSEQSFFCVGDVKQAIYGWRGGVAEIFSAVSEELTDINERPLDTSWRSSPLIIKTVNQIFERLQQHPKLDSLAEGVSAWQAQFIKHQSAQPLTKLNGYACLQAARLPEEKETESQKNVTLRFAAEQVATWKQAAPGYSIGVLVRQNTAVRRLIYELREMGVEASEEGGNLLDDSAAVRVILSTMQWADHPSDSIAHYHISTSPLAKFLGLAEPKASIPKAAGKLAQKIRHQLVREGYGPTVYQWSEQLAVSCNQRELRRLEKLISLAYQYEDSASSRPSDFVTYVGSRKIADPIAADVRVMTVHQAKGLEFDIVVLADLETDLIGQRKDLIFGRPAPTKGIDRVTRYCGKEIQQLMPLDWQELFRSADNDRLKESLCVLYVAVTRAVHALHMIVTPSPHNEKSLRKTSNGLLRAALTSGERLEAGQIGYEIGEREWYKTPGKALPHSVAQRTDDTDSLPALAIKLAKPPKTRWRGLERISPSGLEGGHIVQLPQSVGEGPNRARALRRGTLIHAWFEQIEWLDEGLPSPERLRQVADHVLETVLPTNEFEALLADFQQMIKQPAVQTCLHRATYDHTPDLLPQVENERAIAVRQTHRLLVGHIDRLVTSYRAGRAVAADIIDFKTDTVAQDDSAALRNKITYYRPQLQAYRDAVAAQFRLPPDQVRAKLLFVGIGKICDL